MIVVAVVGSRGWREPVRVASFVWGVAAKYPDAVIVSGGCQTGKPRKGVDWAAEKAALDAGLRVVSFRPERGLPHEHLPPVPGETRRGDEGGEVGQFRVARAIYCERVREAIPVWRVVRYELALDMDTGWPVERQTLLSGRYLSFRDAAFARNTMVVEVSTQVVAFHDGASPGTWHVRREADRLGRPLHLR